MTETKQLQATISVEMLGVDEKEGVIALLGKSEGAFGSSRSVFVATEDGSTGSVSV